MLSLIFYFFISALALEILQYIILYSSLAFRNAPLEQTQNKLPPVSVIIYIENQEDRLNEFLLDIIHQDYPCFEIILVNNASYDNSLEILEEFVLSHSKVHLVNVINNEAFWANKKYALTLGIKTTKYDHFIFIEPDVTPNSDKWLLSMGALFTNKKKVIIGHTSYAKKKLSFLNQMIRFENTRQSIETFSQIGIGTPMMGNAYNQGYTKDLFYKVNGFINHMKTPFGDQCAFIEQISTKQNVAACFSSLGFVRKQAPKKMSEYKTLVKTNNLLLKNSRLSYQFTIRFFSLVRILLFCSAITLLMFTFQWKIVLGLFLFRYLIILIYHFNLFRRFDNKDLIYTYPILEIIHIFISTYYTFTHFITGKSIEKNYR